MYKCICPKCQTNFTSNKDEDFDGVSFCPTCTEEKKEIAKKVDEQIAQRRAGRTEATPSVYQEIRKKKKGSVTYMNI